MVHMILWVGLGPSQCTGNKIYKWVYDPRDRAITLNNGDKYILFFDSHW